MKIGLFDYDKDFLSEETKYINKYLCDVEVKIYEDKQSILNDVWELDVLILETSLHQMSGILLAKYIKQINKKLEIVFVTEHKESIYDVFKVKPFGFVLKSDIKKRLSVILKDLYFEHKKSQRKIRCKNILGEIIIEERKIYKIEKKNTVCNVFCVETPYKEIGVIHMPLKKVISILSDENFCLINQSQIINFIYVKEIKKEQLFLTNGDLYYISRREKKRVIEKYLKYKLNYD